MSVAAEVPGDRIARSSTCAWPGCPQSIPAGGRGMALYCDQHKTARGREMRRQQVDAAEIRDFGLSRERVAELLDQERAGAPVGSYEARALGLAKAGRELDVAIGARIAAHLNEDRAREIYRRFLRALAEAEGF